MKYFMESYNNFEKEMKFIHIAGTNGKGSCTDLNTVNFVVGSFYTYGTVVNKINEIKYSNKERI